MYYSQFGEDKILAKIFNEKKHGFCIEVGANDGINDSTTYYFEKLGWECILVEPNPVLCKMIRETRNSKLYEFAASDKNDEVTLFVAEGAERAHGVSTISTDQESLNKIKSYGFTYNKVQVQTKTLDEILIESKISSEIDFVSIDVEGHEIGVLRGFSIERWMPTVVLLEDNSNFESAEVRNYLKSYGYVGFMRTGVNDWYARKDNKKLVSFSNRSKYNWKLIKVRLKNKIRKIPGIIKFKSWLVRFLVKSA